MIKYIKNNGFAQVRGNEDKIIKALLNNEYYDEWEVSQDENYINFDLCRKNKGICFDNHPDTWFEIKDTGEVSVSMYMAPTNEVYYATTFSPEPETESTQMIINAPNFIQLDINEKEYGVAVKLTLREKSYMLTPGDILLFNQENELTDILQDPTQITLIHNGFYRVDANKI